jgi:hypothetical protein
MVKHWCWVLLNMAVGAPAWSCHVQRGDWLVLSYIACNWRSDGCVNGAVPTAAQADGAAATPAAAQAKGAVATPVAQAKRVAKQDLRSATQELVELELGLEWQESSLHQFRSTGPAQSARPRHSESPASTTPPDHDGPNHCEARLE